MAGKDASQLPIAVKNGAEPPAKPIVSDALGLAIDSLGGDLLRQEVKALCYKFPAIVPVLEYRLLIKGKDVVPYHADTASEDSVNSDTESGESVLDRDSDASDATDSDRKSKKKYAIAIGGESYTPKMAMCKNCDEEFDVTLNYRGDCVWHPGMKTVNYGSSNWDDHDEGCHGPYEAFEDDPDMANGFTWDCCDTPGDDEGCKSTKHKADVNLVVPMLHPEAPSKKRKPEENSQTERVKRERKW